MVGLGNVTSLADHYHSEDEQDMTGKDNRKGGVDEDIRSDTGEEMKMSRKMLLEGTQPKPQTKRATTNLLSVPREAKDVVSVTSTKKATIDDNEPGVEETIEQRVRDLKAIHDAKIRHNVRDEEEEKKMNPGNSKPSPGKHPFMRNCTPWITYHFLYLAKHAKDEVNVGEKVVEEFGDIKEHKHKDKESGYMKYVLGAIAIGAVALMVFKGKH